MINWKLRVKNKVTLVALIGAIVSFVYTVLGLFNIVPAISEEQTLNVFMMLVDILVMLGIVVDPTTEGVKDSIRALGYTEPASDDFAKEALATEGVEVLDEDEPPEGIGGDYTPRLKAPSKSDKNWIHTSKGGKNSCILITGNSVLPNCVGYAWGRWLELLGKTPKLSRANAEDWWAYKDGYDRGQTPKLGAVAVWRKGKVGVNSDGAGHVAIVENIASDGTITFGQSGYGYKRFYVTKMKKPFNLGGTYHFLGFIYLPQAKQKGETSYSGMLPTKTIKKGSRGKQVEYLQQFLNWYGNNLKVDGDFGAKTDKALRAFQKAKGLEADGIAGPKTRAAMVDCRK